MLTALRDDGESGERGEAGWRGDSDLLSSVDDREATLLDGCLRCLPGDVGLEEADVEVECLRMWVGSRDSEGARVVVDCVVAAEATGEGCLLSASVVTAVSSLAMLSLTNRP